MNATVTKTMLAASLAGVPGIVAGQHALPIADGKWALSEKGAAIESADGRDVLALDTGSAHRRDIQLQDGTIELDVQLTRRRSFVYLLFRMADDGEHEEIYLRPHKSGLPDAVQYAPVFQGQSAWQLYHGAGATAAVDFEPGAWTHLKLVLQGARAALFIGNGDRPALVVPRLAREPRSGYLALRAFVPPGTPGEGSVARFANVTVRPGIVAAMPPSPSASEPEAGVSGFVRAWSVSRAFLPKDFAAPGLPAPALLGAFRRVEAGLGGLLELHRSVTVPPGSRAAAAVARVHVRAAKEGPRAFDLGFSDRAAVFVNGRPVFEGEGSYSFDAPRREGLIGYDQARLWLPLAAGDNELLVVVSDGFGGWGLMGRFPDSRGLEVEAR